MTRRTLPLPDGFEFEDFCETCPGMVERVEPAIVDPGRKKPVPRTLQQAFPMSEGYKIAAGRATADGRIEFAGAPPPRLISIFTPDRLAWLCVWALIAVGIVMAWRTPKGLG